jgi:elongation factor Ts
LEQEYVKDDSKTIEILQKEMTAMIGEKVAIRRFTRYEMGEGIAKKEENFAEEVMKQIH